MSSLHYHSYYQGKGGFFACMRKTFLICFVTAFLQIVVVPAFQGHAHHLVGGSGDHRRVGQSAKQGTLLPMQQFFSLGKGGGNWTKLKFLSRSHPPKTSHASRPARKTFPILRVVLLKKKAEWTPAVPFFWAGQLIPQFAHLLSYPPQISLQLQRGNCRLFTFVSLKHFPLFPLSSYAKQRAQN